MERATSLLSQVRQGSVCSFFDNFILNAMEMRHTQYPRVPFIRGFLAISSFALLIAAASCGTATRTLTTEEERIFARAAQNADVAREGFVRSNR